MNVIKLLLTVISGLVLYIGPSWISTTSLRTQPTEVVHDTIYVTHHSATQHTVSSTWHTISRTTVYNPTTSQCDDSPLVTADCSKIDLHKLKNNQICWVALSRDLLSKFPYGTKIEIYISDNHPRNGIYEVHDTMNKRYTNTMDLLTYNDTRGKWNNIKIRKV